jgi:hypothetical protein
MLTALRHVRELGNVLLIFPDIFITMAVVPVLAGATPTIRDAILTGGIAPWLTLKV